MKVMGFVLCVLASLCLLQPSVAAPAPLDPITTAAFTTAGGLVLTGISGSVVTIPTASLLLGKTIAIKGLALKLLARRG